MAETRVQKPSSAEDEFFVREDAEKKRRLALAVKRQTGEAERERLRALHHMRCPKCGMELKTVAFRGVDADLCFACGGLFLDRGEIDLIARPEQKGIMAGILGLTRHEDATLPGRGGSRRLRHPAVAAMAEAARPQPTRSSRKTKPTPSRTTASQKTTSTPGSDESRGLRGKRDRKPQTTHSW